MPVFKKTIGGLAKGGLTIAEYKILFHLNRFNRYNSTKQACTLTVMSVMELLIR